MLVIKAFCYVADVHGVVVTTAVYGHLYVVLHITKCGIEVPNICQLRKEEYLTADKIRGDGV